MTRTISIWVMIMKYLDTMAIQLLSSLHHFAQSILWNEKANVILLSLALNHENWMNHNRFNRAHFHKNALKDREQKRISRKSFQKYSKIFLWTTHIICFLDSNTTKQREKKRAPHIWTTEPKKFRFLFVQRIRYRFVFSRFSLTKEKKKKLHKNTWAIDRRIKEMLLTYVFCSIEKL